MPRIPSLGGGNVGEGNVLLGPMRSRRGVQTSSADCLRNTRQIHEAFKPLALTRITSRGGEGPDVHFIPATDDPVGTADDAIDILLEAGWAPATTPCSPRASATTSRSRLAESRGQVGHWRTHWDDDVFYGHVFGCKGLERPAVVLCGNETKVQDRSREKLYVGMSRATDQLIVVGDPDLVREMGGPAVAEQLGIRGSAGVASRALKNVRTSRLTTKLLTWLITRWITHGAIRRDSSTRRATCLSMTNCGTPRARASATSVWTALSTTTGL